MDLETAEAIDALRVDLRRVESTLSARIEHSEESLRAEMAALGAELRRHAQVLNGSVRDDIRIVAEAVAALTVKVVALRQFESTLGRQFPRSIPGGLLMRGNRRMTE